VKATTWAGSGPYRIGFVRYQINSVPGVAQVASVGGYPIEYQIDVDPQKTPGYGITLASCTPRWPAPIPRWRPGHHKGNAEYLIRSVGWIRSVRDIESIVVRPNLKKGTPVLVSNLAHGGPGAGVSPQRCWKRTVTRSWARW